MSHPSVTRSGSVPTNRTIGVPGATKSPAEGSVRTTSPGEPAAGRASATMSPSLTSLSEASSAVRPLTFGIRTPAAVGAVATEDRGEGVAPGNLDPSSDPGRKRVKTKISATNRNATATVRTITRRRRSTSSPTERLSPRMAAPAPRALRRVRPTRATVAVPSRLTKTITHAPAMAEKRAVRCVQRLAAWASGVEDPCLSGVSPAELVGG
jgi:hypothetical protein